MKNRCLRQALAGCAALVLLLLGGSARVAFAQVFTVDTNQSTITISGTVVGTAFTNQAPGSLTTRYQGQIQTALNGSAIQFTGGSLIEALNNGNWQPNADGTVGSQPANYGAQAANSFATARAALRQIQLDVLSPLISQTNGQFDSRSLTFHFPSNAPSAFAYNVTGLVNKSGIVALTGYATNAVTTQAALATVGNQQVLTIPVDATFFLSLINHDDTTIRLQGQFVATNASQTQTPPVLSLPVISNRTVTLSWHSATGQAFQVQSSLNLSAWATNASNVTSTSTSYTWSGPASAANQFFRLAK